MSFLGWLPRSTHSRDLLPLLRSLPAGCEPQQRGGGGRVAGPAPAPSAAALSGAAISAVRISGAAMFWRSALTPANESLKHCGAKAFDVCRSISPTKA